MDFVALQFVIELDNIFGRSVLTKDDEEYIDRKVKTFYIRPYEDRWAYIFGFGTADDDRTCLNKIADFIVAVIYWMI
jgi:hypothetical protein